MSDQADITSPAPPYQPLMPSVPVLIAGTGGAVWLSDDGEVEHISAKQVYRKLQPALTPVVCHRRATARKLGMDPFPCLDVLELYAFVRPARFALPTPLGLAQAVGVPLPGNLENAALCLIDVVRILLSELHQNTDKDAIAAAWAMSRGGWLWAPAVMHTLGAGSKPPHDDSILRGLRVWVKIKEWRETAPEAPPGTMPVEAVEARARLVQMRGTKAEERTAQLSYASSASTAFMPRDRVSETRFVLSEAGTGVGKTLGYIAPASVWAEKNQAPVWISTFTRNLQRQLDGELDRLYPDPQEKEKHVVIRKGRENYLCLLNMEEAVRRLPVSGAGNAIALGLLARWALSSRDGDMIGGDFPAWLSDLLGRGLTLDLTDTRGECLHSACDHYRKCFVEHTIRRAKTADIVVANHALVMIQAALGGDEGQLPLRYVFDEGHHLFGAADSAFSADLSGRETAELRRWLLGAEESNRSRSRGLRARIGELIHADEKAEGLLDKALQAARALPGPAWGQRISGGVTVGPTEAFLSLVRGQVYARDKDANSPYALEAPCQPLVPELAEAASALQLALADLGKPLSELIERLSALLDDDADELDTSTRIRIEGLCQSLERRALQQVAGWRDMLKSLGSEVPEQYSDWFGVERFDGRDSDVGFHRHWVDPTRPFIKTLVEPAHGVLVTSATLTDKTGDEEADWLSAEARTGAKHLSHPAIQNSEQSPFDYAKRTKILVVGDVSRNNPDQISAAYRELFLAAGGGGLGLFTAISRLRAIQQRICGPLEAANIPLYAQHVDGMDTGSLVDIFRAEENSCLLGTDAVRDGVDVPGRSLRLIVFDRVPWPRPDILHKARRDHFGGRSYDEMLTRLKLKQAYGRLLRQAGDKGVFVMLDRSLPTRLTTAFPEGVEVERIGLKEAIAITRNFLADESSL